MKRKGKILAAILAISMLASIASTTAFAASPAIPSSALGEAAQDRIISSMEQVDIASVGETQYLVVGVESTSIEKPALFFLCDDETVAELSNTFVASVGDLQYVPGYNDLSDAEKLELQTQSIGNYVVTVTGLKQGTTVINVLTEGNLTLDIPVNVAQVQGPHLNVTNIEIDPNEYVTLETFGYEGSANNLIWMMVDENGVSFDMDQNFPPIYFDLPAGIQSPTGSTASIFGIAPGAISVSCIDTTKIDMNAYKNASSPNEAAALLKPGILGTCQITVTNEVGNPHISTENLELTKGESKKLEVLGYEGYPMMLLWQPIDENGNFVGEPSSSIYPIGISSYGGTEVIISGLNYGDAVFSCVDTTKVNKKALEDAVKNNDTVAYGAALKVGIIGTCHITVME